MRSRSRSATLAMRSTSAPAREPGRKRISKCSVDSTPVRVLVTSCGADTSGSASSKRGRHMATIVAQALGAPLPVPIPGAAALVIPDPTDQGRAGIARKEIPMSTESPRRGGPLVWLVACAAFASTGGVLAREARAGALRGAGGEGRRTRTSVTLAGFVLAPDGSPAEGAVVTSSAGGKAVTDAAGDYRLEVEVPLAATSVQVTAVSGAGA